MEGKGWEKEKTDALAVLIERWSMETWKSVGQRRKPVDNT